MKKETYIFLENYMLSCMVDSAHDKEHIYRVLYNALEIAEHEADVDYDVLICACLLHDIGRKEQFENPKLCHAQVGAAMAKERQKAAVAYYESLLSEVSQGYEQGSEKLVTVWNEKD